MLSKIELKLNHSEEIVYQMSSLFHGALMEMLPEEYAEYLHVSQLHPYTQHLEFRNGAWFWVVCCLNKKAAKIIIYDTLMGIESIFIKNRKLEIRIVEKSYSELPYKSLMDSFYDDECSRYINIQFTSPAAFKKDGRYVFYPDIRCIFQSLMNKYDAAVSDEVMADEDTLEQLCENAQIAGYDLKSVNFSLEGVRIPSFIGKLTIKMRGTSTMVNFANMLFRFGTYSGIGIKTSLGMGSFKILKYEGRKR